MAHTDLHAKTEAKVKASQKKNTPKTPAKVPETIAKPSTPNETQSISKDGFLIEVIYYHMIVICTVDFLVTRKK